MTHSWSFMTICVKKKSTRVAPKNNYCLDYRQIFVPKKVHPHGQFFFPHSSFFIYPPRPLSCKPQLSAAQSAGEARPPHHHWGCGRPRPH